VLTRLRRFWHSFSWPLRQAALLLWTLGCSLLMLGWQGDRAGWWATRPFATNLVSSLASACFGIPVALLVLQRLSATQADVIERHAAGRLAVRAAVELSQAARDLFPYVTQMDDELQTQSRLGQAFTGLQAVSANLGRLAAPDKYVLSRLALTEELHVFVVKAQETSSLCKEDLRRKTELTAATYTFCAQWSFLKSHVRSRLAEVDIPWLPAALEADLDGVAGRFQITDGSFAWVDWLVKPGGLSSFVKVVQKTIEDADDMPTNLPAGSDYAFDQLRRAEQYVQDARTAVTRSDELARLIGHYARAALVAR
jgi:hypothetical protein